MLPVRLIVGPSPSIHLYARAHCWCPPKARRDCAESPQCVDLAPSGADLSYLFDATRHESVILVDVGLLSARERAAIAEEIRIIRLVWREVRISDPNVVAQVDADPGRVPVLC